MALRWRNSYSCNIREIDKQHRKLFEIGSKLTILEPICSQIIIHDEILEVISELKGYTVYHFEYEERLMLKLGYGDYDGHKQEHEAFVNKVLELEQNSLYLNNPAILKEIIDFIYHWISDHILETDMKYKGFFNDCGIF